MHEADLEAIRAGYAAFAGKAYDEMLEHIHPEVELHTYAAGVYLGHDGMMQWIASMDEAWEVWHVEVEELIDVGPRAIVVAVLSGRSRLNKIDTDLRFWIVWEVRDAKVALGRHLTDLQTALEHARAPVDGTVRAEPH